MTAPSRSYVIGELDALTGAVLHELGPVTVAGAGQEVQQGVGGGDVGTAHAGIQPEPAHTPTRVPAPGPRARMLPGARPSWRPAEDG